MPRKPNPELIDDDAPEATEKWFAKARPAGEILPALFGKEMAKELLTPKTRTSLFRKPKRACEHQT